MTDTATATGRIDEQWLADFAERYLQAWNGHEPQALLDLMTEDIVYDDAAWPRTMRSHADVREFLEHAWRAIPDMAFEVLEGPFLDPAAPKAVFRWRGTGTFTGPMDPPGFAPTNGRIEFTGFDLHEYRDGRLSRLRILFDNGEVGRQIGAMPEPGSRAERLGAALQRLTARRMRSQARR
jgi:steroid delta-isomerase-like uncharacterized protein